MTSQEAANQILQGINRYEQGKFFVGQKQLTEDKKATKAKYICGVLTIMKISF